VCRAASAHAAGVGRYDRCLGGRGQLYSVTDAGKHVGVGIEGIGMSAVVMVIVGLRSSGWRICHDQAVYGEADRLTLSESFGCLVNSRDNQKDTFYNPRLSLDNLGWHDHTGDKE